jgi:hypothetical protein
LQYVDGSAYEGCWIDDRIEGRGGMHYSCGMADVALWKGGVCMVYDGMRNEKVHVEVGGVCEGRTGGEG